MNKGAKPKTKSNFTLALEARQGKIPVESLPGAAKLLCKDKSLTQAALEGYAKTKTEVHGKQFVKSNVAFKSN